MQVKQFLHDMAETTVLEISETWIKKEDDVHIGNLEPHTHMKCR